MEDETYPTSHSNPPVYRFSIPEPPIVLKAAER